MRKKTGKETTGKIFKRFWVMLLVFALIIPSMNGITVQAHADDTASVWKIYATVSGEDFTDLELVTASESVEGKELIAKFITDGTYTLTEEDRDKTIIADNAELTAGDFNVDALKLSGTSSLIYPGYVISSTEERFRSYSASGAAITIEGLEAHYDAYGTPYYVGPDPEDPDNWEKWLWGTSYDFTVSGNTTIAGFPEQDPEDPEKERISPYWIGYNDTVVTSTGNISIEEGGHLIIEGTLKVEDGGKITGSGDDHYLRVCEGAVVTGLPLYAETPDNDVSEIFSTPNHGECEFRYDSETGKWICPFDPAWPVFYFNVGGLRFSENENENEGIALKYKYSEDDSYIDVEPVVTYDDGMTVGYGISLKEIPETAYKIYLNLTFFPAAESTKTIVCWDVGDFNFLDEGISGNVLEYAFNLEGELNISLGYLNSGNPKIMDTADNYLYAYTGTDDEIKGYLATELYNRFISVAMFEDFGLGNAEDLAARIEKTGSLGDINAIDKEGTSVTIPVNNYKVSWGYNMDNGDPVESNIPVYTLPDKNDFLICTDFNKDNGTGETFYIRKAHADEVPFDGTAQEAIPVIVSSINPDTIVIGGMGADTNVQNSDNVYAFNINSRWLNAKDGPSQPTDPADYGTIVRIMIGSETYVMLTGNGETKNYGGIGNNGFGTDTIWNTSSDGDAEASVYIGLSTLYIRPLAEETGVTVREITAVELADESLAAGVHIVTKDNGDIEITFDSNFYATIPLNITYSDGKTRHLTINRVGLVIQYMYLSGDPNEDHDTPDHLDMGFDHREGTIGLDYDYFAGEQIAVYGIYYTPTNDPTGNSSDLSLYMTFDDGTHRVITAENNDILTLSGGGEVTRGFDGRMAATNDSVATTVFLIGFAEAKTFDGILWIGNVTDTYYSYNGNKGFYANVLNAGWDDDDNFGGTQVGSGKGIYWDGHITWY